MPVIAMNREMGSQGRLVAEALAAELDLKIVRHEIIDHVAQKMHVRKSTLQRFLEGKAGLLERWGTDESSLALYRSEEVLDLARQGNVIIRGWSAVALLRPIRHVVCVRIGAPLHVRVRWLMERLETDDEEMVTEQITQSDAAHTANMQHAFGVRWGDPMLYDMVLNTEHLTVASCVEQIKSLIKRPEFQETRESRAQLENLTLEYHVRAALRSDERTAEVHITIEIAAGDVTLSGIVISDAELRAVRDVVSKVSGVTKVHSKLKVMKDSKIFPLPRS
ncbi:MAG: cytidylate kinase family protein [Pseudomonadota bacterium]|nr:MAG: cytidylate kinase family protein [Pseudomonadota bacterium]